MRNSKSIFDKEYRKKSDDLWDNFFEPVIESVKQEKSDSLK